MTYGSNNNCLLRTKGGCVVVVPMEKIDAFMDQHKDAEIVKPLIKN